MKKIYRVYLILTLFVFVMVSYYGCSKIENNLTTAPDLGIHPAGWVDKTSANFHGKTISSQKWSTESCKPCHGSNLRGGSSGKDCNECHTGGVTDCRLCHGSLTTNGIWPPKALNGETSVSYIGVGVHNIHMTRDSTLRISARVRCVSCHRAFPTFEDTLHIGNNPDNIAEVKFDSLAITKTPGINPVPVWNRVAKTCANSYCHGNFKNGNTSTAPVWTAVGGAACGTCHGNSSSPLPGGTHLQGFTINQCWYCHGTVMDTTGTIRNKSLHINGIVNYNE